MEKELEGIEKWMENPYDLNVDRRTLQDKAGHFLLFVTRKMTRLVFEASGKAKEYTKYFKEYGDCRVFYGSSHHHESCLKETDIWEAMRIAENFDFNASLFNS